MVRTFVLRLLLGLAVVAVVAFSVRAQTKLDLQHQARGVDFTGATYTKPVRMGNALPSTCMTGEGFLLSSAPAGSNLYFCLAMNVWVLEGPSGTPDSSGSLSSLATAVSGPVLTIGAGCSSTTPCNVRVGSVIYAITNTATANLSGGTGTAYVYVTSAGALTVGHDLNLTCTAVCSAVSGITGFPTGSFPIATWAADSGIWGTGTDVRATFGTDPITVSTGLVGTQFAGSTDLSVDTTVIPTYRALGNSFSPVGDVSASTGATLLSPGLTVTGLNGVPLSGLSSGLLKILGGTPSTAVAGTDYAPATAGTSLLKANGSGGFSSATPGADYTAPPTGVMIQKGNGSGGLVGATSSDVLGLFTGCTGSLHPAADGNCYPDPTLTSLTYNQGSSNAVNLSQMAKNQQSLSFDDFGASPSASASTNTTSIQNAINYAAPLGIALTCQGNYQINGTLTPVDKMHIFGHGSSANATGTGCSIRQTATVPIFTYPANGQAESITLTDMSFTGGTSLFNLHGTDYYHIAGASDSKFIRVYTSGQTVAVFDLNENGAIQDMYSEYCTFAANGAGTSVVLETSATGLTDGYIVAWISNHDTFSNADYAFNVDSPQHSGGWYFMQARFVTIRKTILVLAGSINIIKFTNGFSSEQVFGADVSPIDHATCSTAGANATTLTCTANYADFVNGQVLTVRAGATNPTFGGTSPGWDFQTTIVSGGGTGTLTVSPAIPLQVASVSANVTNALYDFIDLVKSPITGYAPQNVSFENGIFNGNRYSISAPYSIYTLEDFAAPSNTVYDPSLNGQIDSANMSSPLNGTQMRTAWPWPTNNPQNSVDRAYAGDNNFPTIYRLNPTIGGLMEFCGDGQGLSFCGSYGNYGSMFWRPRGKPWTMVHSGDNGNLYINPFLGGQGGNLVLRQAGFFASPFTMPDAVGASNALILTNGTCLTTPASGVGEYVVESGEPHFCNQSGTDEKLTPPTGIAPIVVSSGAISCASATSSTVGCVRPDNTTITVSGGVLSAAGGAASAIVTGAGAPSASDGAIEDNTTQKALQVTVNGIQGQSIPVVPSVSVPIGDLVCQNGSDLTIAAKTITAATNATNAVLTISAGVTGWTLAPGTPVTISGSADAGWNGNYTVVSATSLTSITISLNSFSLGAFTGAGSPIISLRCSNSSDATSAGGGFTSFATTYTAPANAFAAVGKQLSIGSEFSIFTSTTQTNNNLQLNLYAGGSATWTTNGSTATGGLTTGDTFKAEVDITAATAPGASALLVIGGGTGINVPGFLAAGLYNQGSNMPQIMNTSGTITYTYKARWTATGAGGTITAAQGSATSTGSAGQYCLATATGTQNGGTGAVWYFVLTGTNSIAGSQTFSKLPGANTGSGYTAVPTTTWTLSVPTSNSVSGITPAAACSGVATATGGSLVGAMGNAVAQLTQRRIWYY
jgi:hypothetical protein